MTDELYRQAVTLSRDGRKKEAQVLLEQVINQDPSNEVAWLWYADTFTTYKERISVLEECLRINPGAQGAWHGIVELNANYQPDAEAPSAVDTSPINQELQPAPQRALLPDTDLPDRAEGVLLSQDEALTGADASPFTDIPDDLAPEIPLEDQLTDDRSVFTVSPQMTQAEQPVESDWNATDVFVEESPDLQKEVLEGVKAAALILDDAETRALLSEMQGNSPQKVEVSSPQSGLKQPRDKSNGKTPRATNKTNWALIIFLSGVGMIVLIILMIFVVLGYLTI